MKRRKKETRVMDSFYWSSESPFVLSRTSYIKGAKTVGLQVVIVYTYIVSASFWCVQNLFSGVSWISFPNTTFNPTRSQWFTNPENFSCSPLSLLHFHSVWHSLTLVARPCNVSSGQSSTSLPSTFKCHLLSNTLCTLKTVIYPHSFSHSLHHTDSPPPPSLPI
jgi:hypothetical protein